MKYEIPGRQDLEIHTIILDLNGTLSVGGQIVDGVKPRLAKLVDLGFKVVLFTGNTRGDADVVAADLGISWALAKSGQDKADLAAGLEPEHCTSIGNGLIDLPMMKTVALSILTMQAEGVHVQTLMHSDIVVPTINDALDLFIDSQRLIATLRN